MKKEDDCEMAGRCLAVVSLIDYIAKNKNVLKEQK